MNPDNRNLIAAIALSMLILIVYQVYFIPDTPPQQAQQEGYAGQTVDGLNVSPEAAAAAIDVPLAVTAPRVNFLNDALDGSISLAGGRIDDLRLRRFGESSRDDENRVALLESLAKKIAILPRSISLISVASAWWIAMRSGQRMRISSPLRRR